MRKLFKILAFLLLVPPIILAIFGYYTFVLVPENKFEAYKQAPKIYDAIIVPGVPLEKENWSQIMQMRVFWSYYLYKEGIAKNIIYSGSAVYTPFIESRVMALYAEELGIAKEHIFEDSLAEHSTENIYYSYKLGQKLGFETIALTTDPFQSMFLSSFAKEKTPGVDLLPIVYSILEEEVEIYTPQINADLARKENFIALPEREGFFERFRGTRGLKLIEEPY